MTEIETILHKYIRIIPDYPQAGVQFQDITPLLGNANAFSEVVNNIADYWKNENISKVAAIEARGFILGAPVATALNSGFVPIRKKGKLPYETVNVTYSLEYGMDQMEIHSDAVTADDRVLIIDDIIASGGTAMAAAKLLKSIGTNIVGSSFITNLRYLNGSEKLENLGVRVHSLMTINE